MEALNQHTFKLSNFDAFGFDLDHTLCKYNINSLFHLTYDIATKYLVEEQNYPRDILREENNLTTVLDDFYFKGLLLDQQRGNFLKICKDGHIVRGSHGTRQLSDEELDTSYGCERQWSGVALYKKCLTEHGVKAMHLDNRSVCLYKKTVRAFASLKKNFYVDYFQVPLTVTFATIVDAMDKVHGHTLKDYSQFYEEAHQPFRNMYFPDNFAAKKGGFFQALVENTESYTNPGSDSLKSWILTLRNSGKLTFLLSSAFIDYGSVLLHRVLGPDWRKYFDICLFRARKPLFFTDCDHPFLTVTDNFTTGLPAKSLSIGESYLNGNWILLKSFLEQHTGKTNPKVVYIGDSIPSDVLPTRQFSDWVPITIAEELETEDIDVQARRIHKDDRLVLSSKRWGSFFTDHCKVCHRETKTFWHEVLKDNTPLVIPHVDYITELPFDKDLENCTFYPKPAFQVNENE